MGEDDRERERHQRRRAEAHEHAAAVHDKAAAMHRDAADFFSEHGELGKAARERSLGDREARGAEADRREAADALDDLPPDE